MFPMTTRTPVATAVDLYADRQPYQNRAQALQMHAGPQGQGDGADSSGDDPAALTLDEYTEILYEIDEQPVWRATADKEMDYADGNQLDSDLLRKQQELGIPPAIEDLIGPALRSLQGYEAVSRTDWRVSADGGTGGQDVADALNYKLNQAERQSKADDSCTDAFRTQSSVGVGWVEVSRESDPFKFAYRTQAVSRNEIHWDMKALDPLLEDARWLRRQRWLRPERIKLAFPEHAALVDVCGKHGSGWWAEAGIAGAIDGGASTGLRNAWNAARGWSVEEARWLDRTSKELCVAELWYRRWENAIVLKSPDGRVVEFDENNEAHLIAAARGLAKIIRAPVARVRRSYWLGPMCLSDEPTPYTHRHFPYVPFWAFREDRTRVPYGYTRSMIFQQDSVNSGTSKLRWGMSVVRTERTTGAVDMTDAQFRRAIARPDADIKLNAAKMAEPGARFDVKRDYQLSDQHFQLLNDARAAIERVSTITAGFTGRQGTARSGLQEQTQVEQSNQSLGGLMLAFRRGRSQVGELLLAMLIEDMSTGVQEVIIEGDAINEDRTVVLNKPEIDPDTGYQYLSNDLQRTRLKVALDDVPSSSSYRAQQLNALSEAVKSLPDRYKAAVMPFMASLMDVPFKRDLIQALRAADSQESPEAIEQRIKDEVQKALAQAQFELKSRELELRYSPEKLHAEIQNIVADTVSKGVSSAFAAMQAGQVIATMPTVAPIADKVMQGAGYQLPTPAGVDPNFPVPAAPDPGVAPLDVPANTSPMSPPVPQQPGAGHQGIETQTATDNEAVV